MQYAIIDGERKEAFPGGKGFCGFCKKEVFSKCGEYRVDHWAHKGKRDCDPWKESETEWHRAWKANFPKDWQEIVHSDPGTEEKHVADIKTDKLLVIEFQHSPIKPNEVRSREKFYKNMVWVVDGTRPLRDYPRFCKGFNDLRQTVKGFFLSSFPDECFPASWLTSSVPVYFDFQGSGDIVQPQDPRRSALWCLFPNRVEGYAVVAGVLREEFINLASTSPDLLFGLGNLKYIAEYIRLQRDNATAHARRLYPDPLSLLSARRFSHRRL